MALVIIVYHTPLQMSYLEATRSDKSLFKKILLVKHLVDGASSSRLFEFTEGTEIETNVLKAKETLRFVSYFLS